MRLLKTEMVVVPYEARRGGFYSCVVVDPGPQPDNRRGYPVGGYNIIVHAEELATADAVPVP